MRTIEEMEHDGRDLLDREYEANPNPSEQDKVLQKLRSKLPPRPPRPKKRVTLTKAEAGRLGGLKGGRQRAKNMSPEDRSEACRTAALARWAKRKRAPAK